MEFYGIAILRPNQIAGEVGMDEISVKSKLAAGDDQDKLKDQIHQAESQGVSSVPVYMINEKYSISGAQAAEILVSAFDQIANAGS